MFPQRCGRSSGRRNGDRGDSGVSGQFARSLEPLRHQALGRREFAARNCPPLARWSGRSRLYKSPDERRTGPPRGAKGYSQTAAGRPGAHLAYGATLLAVVVAESFILYLQLGDGDILVVSEAGEVSRAPLPTDERLFANETTSLCLRDAWREFRSHFQVISASSPALILVSTDGYGNSFRDEAGFLQVGADVLAMIRADGLDAVSASLETWLTEASQEGSGDDVTLGILCRMDTLEKKLPAGRVPAGQLLSVEEEQGVVMARCSQSGRGFGMRFEEQGRGHWIADWAFDTKETPARREQCSRGEITGDLKFAAAYPGCPHCGAPSIFQCVCGQVACWDGESRTVTCPWCGTTVELRDLIESLSARADR